MNIVEMIERVAQLRQAAAVQLCGIEGEDVEAQAAQLGIVGGPRQIFDKASEILITLEFVRRKEELARFIS